MQEYYKYSYSGSVKEFDSIIAERWEGETMAVSEKKARTNLIYQFKKQFNKSPNSKITLPGNITLVE